MFPDCSPKADVASNWAGEDFQTQYPVSRQKAGHFFYIFLSACAVVLRGNLCYNGTKYRKPRDTMRQEQFQIPGSDVRKLLGAASPDAALLYLSLIHI